MKPATVVSNISHIALRVVADFLIVQTAMLGALLAVALQFQAGTEGSVRLGLAELRHYYLTLFLPLSVLFPLFYALSGLYTVSRTYSKALALRRAGTSACIAALGMLAASFFAAALGDFAAPSRGHLRRAGDYRYAWGPMAETHIV